MLKFNPTRLSPYLNQNSRWMIGLQYFNTMTEKCDSDLKWQIPCILENSQRQINYKRLPKKTHNRYFGTTMKSLGVIKDIGSLHTSPAAPLVLGTGGLIPFVTPPLIMYAQAISCPELIDFQLYYGAVILSFLGGVRWGMAATPGSPIPGTWAQYSWSVTPSLIAWAGLMLPSTTPGCLAIITGLGLTCYKDLAQIGYPSWFRGLRIFLTLFAIGSLGSSLAIIYLFPTKKTLSETLQASKAQLGGQYKRLTELKDSIPNKETQDDVKERESEK